MLGALFLHFNLATQVLLGGSTGVDGVMDQTFLAAHDVDGTAGSPYVLDVPPGGRFEFTTIAVPSGVTVRFRRNQMNDPVYLLATGNVTIAGTVDVSGADGADASGGAGGPGGYDGGAPGFLATPGDGHGPGGGKVLPGDYTSARRSGSHATVGNYVANGSGAIYGSASCFPLIGGSGGAGGDNRGGGGGGGGAILIGSEATLTLTGNVWSEGGSYTGGYNSSTGSGTGAGGCIRLAAKKVVFNTAGSLDAIGTTGGAAGYIRIDTIFRDQVLRSSTPVYTVGTNMVIRLDQQPIIQTLSANGVPRSDNNPDPIIITTPGQTIIPVVVDVANFQSCVALDVMTVPASGAATKTTYLVENGPQNFDVTIPANTATSIEVYGKAVACPD